MKTFIDNKGRAWNAVVNTSALKRVRDALDVNLADASSLADLWRRLLADDLFVVEVAYAIVRPQADALKIPEDDFGDSMAGDVIDGAAQAIAEGIRDFFRDPAIRRAIQALTDDIRAAVAELANAIATVSGSTRSISATGSLGSSGSIPLNSRSES